MKLTNTIRTEARAAAEHNARGVSRFVREFGVEGGVFTAGFLTCTTAVLVGADPLIVAGGWFVMIGPRYLGMLDYGDADRSTGDA